MLATLGLGVPAIGATAADAAPPGRAYELVSPADHLAGAIPGLSADLRPQPGLASSDGDGVLFGATGSMGPNWSGPSNPMIFARRTGSGWQVRATAVRSVDEGNTVLQHTANDARSGWLTRDGRQFVFGTADLGNAPGVTNFGGIYRTTDMLEAPEWLSRPTDGEPAGGLSVTALAAADDTRTVAFQSTAPLVGNAPPAPTRGVYVKRDGELRLVSIDPQGNPFTQSVSLANSYSNGHNASKPPAVSMRNQLADDGRFVLMVDDGAQVRDRALYVHDLDAGVTRQLAGGSSGIPLAHTLLHDWTPLVGNIAGVSIDTQTVPEGYVFAARRAPRAFFHTMTQADPGPFVYEANLETGTATPRHAITGPPMGLSDDGRHMLFLVPPAGATEGTSPAGTWTLRYWSADSPSTSTIVGSVTTTGTLAQNRMIARVYRSSGDGRTWIFTAAGSPDPERPNLSPATQQLYRWTVGDATPTCLSCETTDGVARTVGVNLTVQQTVASEGFLTPAAADASPATNLAKDRIAQPGQMMSEDGRWILFDSPDRLVPEDTNDVRDVYLWDRDAAPGGELQLVSSGTGDTPSWALDMDASGQNAFFTTRDGLIPSDKDRKYDVYVARIDGGFPEPPDEVCTGEGDCRTPTVPAGPTLPLGSNVLTAPSSGPRQGIPVGEPKFRVRSVRTSARQLTVRVDAPEAGRIRVSGARVRNATRNATRRTTYTVRVPLSAKTRRSVDRGRTVRVAIRVQFTSKGSSKTQRVSQTVSVKKGR